MGAARLTAVERMPEVSQVSRLPAGGLGKMQARQAVGAQGTVTPASQDRSPGAPTVTPASQDRSPGAPTVTPASQDRSPGAPTGNREQGTAAGRMFMVAA